MKRNLPTLEDVARRAGVSTATVSRCLNEPDKVLEETSSRVMAAVGELHYSPNFGARAIAANRTGTFGVVIPTMENAIFAQGIEAFQKVLVDAKSTMLLASSSYDSANEAHQIRTLVARGADGLLLIGNERQAEITAFLKERGVASVYSWCCAHDPDQPFVGFDNINASRNLVETAIDMGHRHFVFLSGIREMNDRAKDRVIGARMAIEAAGLDPDAMAVVETEYSVEGGQRAFEAARKQSPQATLAICGNDVLAVGAILSSQAAGLHVPRDISIVGFDDIELASVVRPALTTVHVPHQEMGRIAAETLIELANTNRAKDFGRAENAGKPTTSHRITLDTKITFRESLSSPPQT